MNKAQQSKQDYSVQLTFQYDELLYAERSDLKTVALFALQLINEKVYKRITQMQRTLSDLSRLKKRDDQCDAVYNRAYQHTRAQHKLLCVVIRAIINETAVIDETFVRETLQSFKESLANISDDAFKFSFELYEN